MQLSKLSELADTEKWPRVAIERIPETRWGLDKESKEKEINKIEGNDAMQET